MGFLLPDNKKETLEEFIDNYIKLSERDLYSYYLDKTGIIYKKPSGELDLQKIYSMLKWDLVNVGFIGNTNGPAEEHLPSLVRELELTFHTTLRQPKLFSRFLTGIGEKSDYEEAWRKYLEVNGLVSSDSNEVASFDKEK